MNALITGASSGIGKAISKLFYNNDIGVVSPTRQELNLANEEEVKKYIKQNCQTGIDILVNCAGVNVPFAQEWERILQVNTLTPALLIELLSPYMKRQRFGRIVNISSLYSLRAKEGRMVYAASKAALDSITRTAALELAQYNILVNSVIPGFVLTPMTETNIGLQELQEIEVRIPLERLAQPEEIAELVLFLASRKNTYITGQSIIIDGGLSII